MTSRARKDKEWTQGFWFEFEGNRVSGGGSAQTGNLESGLGAVYKEKELGITGYFQYTLPYLSGRVQLDLLSSQRWVPQVTVGVPLQWKQFKLEPHLNLAFEQDKPLQPRWGLRLQYVF